MPIPKPKDGEKQDDFISRCASMMADDEPDMPNEQRMAMCFGSWKKSKENFSESVNQKNRKYDEDGHIIIAENVKVTFGGSLILEGVDDRNEIS